MVYDDFKNSCSAASMPDEPVDKATVQCALCGAAKSCLPILFHPGDADVFSTVITGKRRIERNAVLCRENDKFDMLYVVRSGQLKVLRRDPGGTLHVVKFYMPGDVIGMDAIAAGVHQVRVMALEDSEVCEISYSNVKQAMVNAPQLGERFLKIMSGTLANHYERSCLLSLPSLDERFASFLLDLMRIPVIAPTHSGLSRPLAHEMVLRG